jgi:hypothetical protein
MCCDLKMILSRLLTQITEHEKGTNQLLPTPTLLILHMESIALSTLQDYPCTSRTTIQVAIPCYALKSIYGAAQGWCQCDNQTGIQSVTIKCTIQSALEGSLSWSHGLPEPKYTQNNGESLIHQECHHEPRSIDYVC